MKTRYGFVSNSSSSSFIVAIAQVNQAELDELEAMIKDEYGMYLIEGKDIIDDSRGRWSSFDINAGRVYVSGGGNIGADVSIPFDENGLYLVANNNGEGDSAFIEYDEGSGWSDYNYDIDLDFFPEKQVEIYNKIASYPVSDYTFGAERNG